MSEKSQERVENPSLKEARQHFKTARQSMRDSFEELLPKSFIEKRRAARKEILLGLKNLLDAAINHVEKK